MKRLIFAAILSVAMIPFLAACTRKVEADLGAPPQTQVEQEQGSGIFKVARPEQFPLAIAGEHKAAP
ncbi:MAG: efflux RND transporter periplasmic adaptor subunit, partial [Syntrophorhabdales bacterium]